MKYKIDIRSIFEFGQRKDDKGNPHQEDCLFPKEGQFKDTDRLFLLCDGMGGHEAGEVASATVCESMSQYILSKTPDPEGSFSDDCVTEAVDAAFDALDAVDKDSGNIEKKMGTTMTMLKLHDKGATIAHMGDSRVYQIRIGETATDTKVLFCTRDHSLVNDLIAVGELTPEQAKTFPQRNVITRALQPHMECHLKADINHVLDIEPGDYFYMCSDGMLENMDDQVICNLFFKFSNDIDSLVDKLKVATDENRDNHSAILVRILDVIDPLTEEERNAILSMQIPAGREGIIETSDDNQEGGDDEIVSLDEPSAESSSQDDDNEETMIRMRQAENDSREEEEERSGNGKTFIFIIFAIAVIALILLFFGPFKKKETNQNPQNKPNVEKPEKRGVQTPTTPKTTTTTTPATPAATPRNKTPQRPVRQGLRPPQGDGASDGGSNVAPNVGGGNGGTPPRKVDEKVDPPAPSSNPPASTTPPVTPPKPNPDANGNKE